MNGEALFEQVKRAIHEIEPDAEIILYGSRAREDSNAQSDWDFLILLDGPVNDKRTDSIRHRLYYARFYAVSALLIQEGLSSSKHTGLRSLFNRHFVRTNKVTKDKARIFNDLFERRQEVDYVDFVSFEESQVQSWLPQAEAFVETIGVLIEKRKE